MKKRTPFKNSKLLLPALFVFALTVFASCENLIHGGVGDDNASVGGGKRPDNSLPGTLAVHVRVGNAGAFARSAAPSAAQDFVYAARLSSPSGWYGDLLPGETADGKSIKFMLQKPAGGETTGLTVEVFAFAKVTTDDDIIDKKVGTNDALLKGSQGGQKIEEGEINIADPIELKPNAADTALKGTVSLKVKVPNSDYTLAINDNVNFTVKGDSPNYTIEQNGDEIKPGIYDLTLVLKKNKEIVLLIPDKINVWPGMCTDTWLGLSDEELESDGDGDLGGNTRILSEDMASKFFFVLGESGDGWYSSHGYSPDIASDELSSGSFMKPFATIQKAVDTVIARNDGASDYTIYVDGTVTYGGSNANGMADFSSLTQSLSLTIKSLDASKKATLDANKKSRVINAAPANGTLNLTIQDLAITGGNTAATGAGAYISNGGTFVMNGKSHFAEDDDIYLCDGATIKIADGFTAESDHVATITPSAYPNGADYKINILYADGQDAVALISGVCAKFSVTPQAVDGGDPIEWKIIPRGDDKTKGILTRKLPSEYYVQGSDGTYNPTTEASDITNDGTKMKPFETIQHAIEVIEGNLVYDDSTIYTIFVDGTLTPKTNNTQLVNIVGANDKDFNLNIKALSDKATLDAKQSGRVMNINAASAGKSYGITLENLVITGGKHDNTGGGICLNGSSNRLTLVNCDVKGNSASNNGGGIFVSQGSNLTVNGGTIGGSEDTDKNTAQKGAGVYVASGGDFTMNAGAVIRGNSASVEGGGVYVEKSSVERESIVAIHYGTISHNKSSSGGAGIHSAGGTIALNSVAKVIDNEGTGICATGDESKGTTLTMEPGAVVGGNNATTDGGGILVNNGSTFTMRGGTIGRNTDVNENSTTKRGGGVYVGRNGTFIMEGGDIIGNIATDKGGGVYVTADDQGKGTFEMKGGTIGGSTADGNTATSGGGVYVVGTFTMSKNSTISGNEAISGGGVYVAVDGAAKGEFTMGDNATISGNKTNSYGGGVWVDGTFTMNGGSIGENNAVAGAGGVYVANNGDFTMTDGAISGNTTDGDGGGVYVESSGTFRMNGGTVGGENEIDDDGNVTIVNGNKTGDDRKGGGVYMNGGDFTMGDTAAVKGNEAKYGGGIYISSGVANMNGGNISNNEANTHGGGIYIVSSASFTMTNATISGNTARNGGGFYNAGATFIMKNGAKINGNHITGGKGTGAYITDIDSSTGVLQISGSAQFGTDNEVYLFYESNAIKIADILTGTGTVATIEPKDYVVNSQVLSGGLYLTPPVCSRFKVKPQSDGSTWSINVKGMNVNSTGVLVKGG